MKTSVASMLIAAIVGSGAANAGEFEVFGVGLDSFADERADVFLQVSESPTRRGFFTDLSSPSDIEALVTQNFAYKLPEYDLAELKTESELVAHSEFQQVLKDYANNADPAVWSSYELQRLGSDEVLRAKAEFDEHLTFGLGAAFTCFASGASSRCPAEFAFNDNISRVSFGRTVQVSEGTVVSSDEDEAFFLALQMKQRVPVGPFLDALQSKYEHASCSKLSTTALDGYVQDRGFKCEGRKEMLIIDARGNYIDILVSPDSYSALIQTIAKDHYRETVAMYAELNTLANKTKTDVEEQATLNAFRD